MDPFWWMRGFFGGDGEVAPPPQTTTTAQLKKVRVEPIPAAIPESPEPEEPEEPKMVRKLESIEQTCAGCGAKRTKELSEALSEDELLEWASYWGNECVQEIDWVSGLENVVFCRICQAKMRKTIKINGRYTRTSFFAEFGQRKDLQG